MVVVREHSRQHNMVRLARCRPLPPHPVLDLPPVWYKSAALSLARRLRSAAFLHGVFRCDAADTTKIRVLGFPRRLRYRRAADSS